MKNIFVFALILSISGYVYGQDKQLTNEEIWYSTKFSSKSISGVRSMNDGEHFTSMDTEGEHQVINKYSYKDYSKVGTVVSSENLFPSGSNESLSISGYSFSADESMVLLSSEEERIYRRSRKAYYYVYNIESKLLIALSDHSKGKQSLAEFSPDGKLVSFVRENNIFIIDMETEQETQVTSDGEFNKIINGSTDWVYEEEFGFAKGLYWSPNGTQIAFYRFDEAHVKQFQMAMYGALYPDQYTFKYPKAGEENAKISIHVYDIAAKSTASVNIGSETNIYIPRIKWMAGNDQLCVYRLNRLQNHLELLAVDTDGLKGTLEAKLFFEEKSDTYIAEGNFDRLQFLDDNRHFLFTSDRDGYMHIYRFTLDGQVANQVTNGNWDIQSLNGIDVKGKTVYYTSREDAPMESAVYSIRMDGSKKTRLTPNKGSNRALFSKGMKYFINYHSSANRPSKVTLHNADGKQLKILEDNTSLTETLSEYELSSKEFFAFTTSENVELNGWMIKPPNFNVSNEYPVLMTVYGGPGSNTVTNGWGGANYLWHQMLAQQGIIVVSVDGRGTGYRGRDFKNMTYKQLGYYETIDQIEAAKYLGSLEYIDASRIGIQGWSYGGYMSSLAITKGADVFNSAIAVAPVTSWRYYDTIYTERFMQTPQTNASGYDENSPINHVEKLNGAYLLVHGSADDNVHYQNSMEMINALVKANKQFDLFIYPDKNHGIYGGTTRLHLYNKMTNFLQENLKTSKNINLLD